MMKPRHPSTKPSSHTSSSLFLSSYLFALFVLCFCISSASGAIELPPTSAPSSRFSNEVALSDVALLLPLTSSKVKVQKTLQGFKSCFRWTNTNPELLQVTPIYDEADNGKFGKAKCSQRVLVSALPNLLPSRSSAWILAEDLQTGNIMRCEVFVDKIANIEILTTTRMMYRDDIENLQIQAFDQEGNAFSSIEGLHFQWSILPTNFAEATGVLKFVPFSQHPVDISSTILQMEKEGKDTSSKLIQGVNTGKATISARLLEPEYEGVKPATVLLSVLEPLHLIPSQFIYVSPGARVNYILQTFKHDAVSTIEMPNIHYVWSTSNETVATVTQTGKALALALGSVEVKVQSTTMPDNQAKASLHVVPPAYLALTVKPVPYIDEETTPTPLNWFLIAGHTYQVDVEVFDINSHKFYTKENLKFEATFNDRYFRVLQSSDNHDRHKVSASKEGLTTISCSLQEITSYHTGLVSRPPQPITARQEVVIISPIRIVPKKSIVLPWDAKYPHSFQLKAEGGSGEYYWHTSDHSIFSVSSSGVITVQGRGKATITAVDKKNAMNKDSIEAYATIPSDITFLPNKLEAQIGSPLHLPVVIKDEEGRVFDNCSALPIEWNLHDPSIFSLLPPDHPATKSVELPSSATGYCSIASFMATKEGHTTSTALYGRLREEITIFSFPPLNILEPTSIAVVAIGSTAQFIYEGGPNPWLYEPSAFYETLTPDHPEKVSVRKGGKIGSSRVLYVTCLELGDQDMRISVGNKPTSTNKNPASVTVTTKFSCALPDNLLLYAINDPTENTADVDTQGARCAEATTFPTIESIKEEGFALPIKYQLRNNRNIIFNATLLDARGRIFTNWSSILLKWGSDNPRLANWHVDNRLDQHHQRLLEVSAGEGIAHVEATPAGYSEKDLALHKIKRPPALDSARLRRQLELSILSNVVLSPENATIYNDEKNVYELTTAGGSLSHHFFSNDTAPAKIHYEGGKSVEIHPRKTGLMKVSVVDLCLGGSQPSSSVIRVSEISAIEFRVRDMVKVGDAIPLEIEALDEIGRPFHISQYRFMNFTVQADNEFLEVTPHASSRKYFTVRGLSPGTGRVSFSSQQRGGRLITSKTKQIFVFPALTLYPRSLLLLPGSSFSLHWSGGPPVRSEVTFTVSNKTVATVDNRDSLGLVQGRQAGRTFVTATVEGFDSLSREKVNYGEDTIEVQVKSLDGIRIHTNSHKLLTGNEMTARVVGTNGETPFTFGTLGLRFIWETVNAEVVRLLPIYSDGNLTLEDESGFSVRVLGKGQGNTRIAVKLASDSKTPIPAYTTSIPISVAEPLRLSIPSHVLVPPHSKFLITTNKDSVKNIRYEVIGDGNFMEVSPRGEISVFDRTGVAFVMVSDESETVILQIQIKPVHQIQVLPATPVFKEVPLGSTMEFALNLRDDYGSLFFPTQEGVNFNYQTNNPDVVSVQSGSVNSTVVVKGLRPGDTILRIYLNKNEALDDYIRLRVSNAILPYSPRVHLGGLIQFSIPLDEPKESRGLFSSPIWRSDNENVLRVDGTTGLAEARGVGSALIFHKGAVDTFTTVTVTKVSDIIVDTRGKAALSNIAPANEAAPRPIRYRVTFMDNGGRILSGALLSRENSIQHNVEYSCNIMETDWAYAMKDEEDNEQYCVVHPRSPSFSNPQQTPSKGPNKLTLVVTAKDRQSNYEFSHQESLPFAPGFLLQYRGDTIRLNPTKKRLTVDVIPGKGPIVATSSDPSKVEVREIKTSGSYFHFDSYQELQRYEIRIVNEHYSLSAPVEITFLDAISRQEEKLRINYDLSETPGVPDADYDRVAEARPGALTRGDFIIGSMVLGALSILGFLVYKVFTAPPTPIPSASSLNTAASTLYQPTPSTMSTAAPSMLNAPTLYTTHNNPFPPSPPTSPYGQPSFSPRGPGMPASTSTAKLPSAMSQPVGLGMMSNRPSTSSLAVPQPQSRVAPTNADQLAEQRNAFQSMKARTQQSSYNRSPFRAKFGGGLGE